MTIALCACLSLTFTLSETWHDGIPGTRFPYVYAKISRGDLIRLSKIPQCPEDKKVFPPEEFHAFLFRHYGKLPPVNAGTPHLGVQWESHILVLFILRGHFFRLRRCCSSVGLNSNLKFTNNGANDGFELKLSGSVGFAVLTSLQMFSSSGSELLVGFGLIQDGQRWSALV